MSEPPYLLDDRDLMRRLMKRTGTGQGVTIRELAERAGCNRTTIGNLLTGDQTCVAAETARAISAAIGVDWPVLFIPTGRAVPAPASEVSPTTMRAAV